jgi:hypothetical protein
LNSEELFLPELKMEIIKHCHAPPWVGEIQPFDSMKSGMLEKGLLYLTSITEEDIRA